MQTVVLFVVIILGAGAVNSKSKVFNEKASHVQLAQNGNFNAFLLKSWILPEENSLGFLSKPALKIIGTIAFVEEPQISELSVCRVPLKTLRRSMHPT